MSIEVYFDHAATTPVLPEVIDEIVDCLTNDYGNPSSLHRLGIKAEKRIKKNKEIIAKSLKASPEEIIFTSGGTESNNLAILGGVYGKRREGNHIITTAIEHPSVLNTFRFLENEGFEVTCLPVDKHGTISLDMLGKAIKDTTIMISIMHVNNEIGVIQPLKEIGYIIKNAKGNPLFHVDAIQSYCKIPISPGEWNIDLLSISGHKINAPKGIGALYKRKGLRLRPIQWGGDQEGGLRSGTENISGIVGLGKSVEILHGKIEENQDKMRKLKMFIGQEILMTLPDAVINGPDMEKGAPHIINIGFSGIKGEVLQHSLEAKGIYVSTGSACSSRKKKLSHVLKAIGANDMLADGSIRISLSYMSTKEEAIYFINTLKETIKEIKRFTRR